MFLKLRVMRHLKRKTEPRQHILNLDHQKLSNAEIRQNLYAEVMRNINFKSNFSYSDVSNAVVNATSNVLPKRSKAQPGWFPVRESRLLPLTKARNNAMRNVFNRAQQVRAQQDLSKLVKTSQLLYMK